MQDITAFDIFDYLPAKIQELLFSQYMDNVMENVFSIASVSTDNQTELHRDVVSVLIGKYDIEKLKELLKNKYELSESMINIVINFLNSKLFGFLKTEMQQTKSIYEQAEKEGVNGINKDMNIREEMSKKSPEKLVSYIQELANALKEKPEETKEEKKVMFPESADIDYNEDGTKEEKPIIKSVPIKREVVINSTLPEEIKEEKKVGVPESADVDHNEVAVEKEDAAKEDEESILLKAMRKNKVENTGKLNEYYKSLKNNLSAVDNKEKENVFQPPFKSDTNNRILIESSFNDGAEQKKIKDEKDSSQEFKTPVKYNSFNYTKKEDNKETLSKNDSKFVDLGDFD